ncbi:class I SAM-dependent methyltransferase [soil metagenome]
MRARVDGYLTDVDYTFGYYPEMNPRRARLSLLNAGITPRKTLAACELGYGQGVSANIHAAASTTAWYGCDVMASHAAFAQSLTAASGAKARFTDEAFTTFCARPDLPDFDFIGLHGVWSWISEDNRAVLVDFLARKLRPGGLVYLTYNALPGWSSLSPLRHLLVQHAERVAPGDRAALDFAIRLQALDPLYSRAGPVPELLEKLKGADERYLAHEYFNDNWRPLAFADVAAQLTPAGLAFAGSATFRDHAPTLTMGPAKRDFQAAITDPVMRETVGDYLVNRNFREDYWIKPPVPLLSSAAREAALGDERFVLIRPRAKVSLAFDGFLGDMLLPAPLYGRILDLLADHRPRTLSDIAACPDLARFALPAIVQALLILTGRDDLALAADPAEIAAAAPTAQALNACLVRRPADAAEITVLASPVTGGGIEVGRTERAALAAGLALDPDRQAGLAALGVI